MLPIACPTTYGHAASEKVNSGLCMRIILLEHAGAMQVRPRACACMCVCLLFTHLLYPVCAPIVVRPQSQPWFCPSLFLARPVQPPLRVGAS